MSTAKIIIGDCVDVLGSWEDNTVDAIVTDPPYGLGFMGKEFDKLGGPDAQKAWHARWSAEAFRVLKPGGHVVAFGGQRTIHHLTVALEGVGFEVRDLFGWLNWQGFPKSSSLPLALDRHLGKLDDREVVGVGTSGEVHRVGLVGNEGSGFGGEYAITAPATPEAEAAAGWGSALKPCLEPAIIVRKPPADAEGRPLTLAANWLLWGTGGLNIDATRHPYGCPSWPGAQDKPTGYPSGPGGKSHHYSSDKRSAEVRPDPWEATALGRWPANVYATPKPSRSEREAGCEGLPATTAFEVTGRREGSAGMNSPRAGIRSGSSTRPGAGHAIRNHHPTVKPWRLMAQLVKLVTPIGGTVVDPFCGSGSTAVAAVLSGYDVIGIELDPDYAKIAQARVEWAIAERERQTAQGDLFAPALRPATTKAVQVALFDDEGGA